MKPSEARTRRRIIVMIIEDHKSGYFRSVDDWYRIVANQWPDGISKSPAKSTVKSVLFGLKVLGLMKHKYVERGWFKQERFA